jgi:hypothetical protein
MKNIRDCNLGYPYSYGDQGPQFSAFGNADFNKISYISVFVVTGLLCSPTAAIASPASKVAAESVRSSACAMAGACVIVAAQQSKCGNIPAATAAMCGAAVAMCIEKTAHAASLVS